MNERLESKLSENAVSTLEKRYLRKDDKGEIIETPRGMFERVAYDIAEADRNYSASDKEVNRTRDIFYNMMASTDFLPNSPTLMNAGTNQKLAYSGCFVLPIEDNMENIVSVAGEAALVHKSGGGTGFSFSSLRPVGSPVGSTSGVATGPVSFMNLFNIYTEVVKQGGRRRGANMGVLRVDHPDIDDFIDAKYKPDEEKNKKLIEAILKRAPHSGREWLTQLLVNTTQLNNFNISVALTEEFMQAYHRGESYNLIDPRTREVVDTKDARKTLDKIVDRAYSNGEPGIIFIDRINEDNPTPHLGEIESTNPCGEQPLLGYESCNLGSINLKRFVKDDKVDYERLREITHKAVHFLDNVIDRTNHPLGKIEEMTTGNRKIGLGIMGFADMLYKLEIPYDSTEAIRIAENVMKFITEESMNASEELAKTRGVFPNFKGSIYDKDSKNFKGEDRKLRNATTTTIAPTGSISIIAGCSGGMEPIYSIAHVRKTGETLGTDLYEVYEPFKEGLRKSGIKPEEVGGIIEKVAENRGSLQGLDCVPKKLQDIIKTAHDLSPLSHLEMLVAFQGQIHNAVSKTINMPSTATPEDVKEMYLEAHRLRLKGVTIFRDGSRGEAGQLLVSGDGKESKLEEKVNGNIKFKNSTTYEVPTGCGALWLTVTHDKEGRERQLFCNMSPVGGCGNAQTATSGILMSKYLESGEYQGVRKHLVGITCPKSFGFGEDRVTSCTNAAVRAIDLHIKRIKRGELGYFPKIHDNLEEEKPEEEPKEQKKEPKLITGSANLGFNEVDAKCPDCGSALKYTEGCKGGMCVSECGYSSCS